MKKMFFLATIALSVSMAIAQQPVTKKATSKVSKKEVKKVVKAEVTKAVEVLDPSKAAAAVSTPLVAPVTNTTDPSQFQVSTPATPAAPQVDVNKVFEFTNDNYDFGKIVGGKAVEYTISIKNVSKEEAALTFVQPTCGCTTPKYEANKKFAPGETVQVILGFNGGSPGQATPFNKAVTITLNGTLTKTVTFKGETYVAPAEPAPANPSMNKF